MAGNYCQNHIMEGYHQHKLMFDHGDFKRHWRTDISYDINKCSEKATWNVS